MARTGRPKAELILSDAERTALEGWVRRRSTPQAWALRCRIILACASGASSKDVAVHLVLDHCATHKTPAIKTWLVARPGFHLHFTPTGSSWLDLVERWFAELTDKQIRRGVHKSVQALEKDIRTWTAAWNTDPKPYAWTRTADEILERLAGCLNRIPDSEDQRPREVSGADGSVPWVRHAVLSDWRGV